MVLIVHDICRRSFGGWQDNDAGSCYMDDGAEYLQHIYGAIYNKIQPGEKIVLVGSKYDMRHIVIVEASKQIKLLKSVASTIPCQFILTSSKENLGIKELREFIVNSSKDMQLYRQDPDNCINIEEVKIKEKCTIV